MNGTNAERREKNRLPVRPLEPTRPSAPAPYRLVDISRSGCLVESREPLGEVASAVRLRLPLPKRAERNNLIATIVWKSEVAESDEKPSCRYGLRFEAMDAASHDMLNLYLNYLQRDWHITGLDEAWRKIRGAAKGEAGQTQEIKAPSSPLT